jgi:hypothetical protein
MTVVATEAIKTKVKQIAAESTAVPISSKNMTNCIEKQKIPQSSLTNSSSIKLWIVELIHLRQKHCEGVWYDHFTNSLWDEHHLSVRQSS